MLLTGYINRRYLTMFRSSVICWGFLLALCASMSGTLGANVEPCPIGWIAYQKEIPNTCLYVSDSTASSLNDAHQSCVGKNASLIVIQSEEKMQFFKSIVQNYLSSSTKIWIGLQKSGYEVTWLTKDGKIPANHLPSGMQYSGWGNYDYRYGRSSGSNGLIYQSNSLHSYSSMRYDSSSRFICEKRSDCTKGWYGLGCDKQCNCYGQECDSSALEVICDYGCKVGWMGEGCSQRKEDADVRYFCVNSPDQGKYAHIRIDTKGIEYENIHAVDEDSQVVSWCNNTVVETNTHFSIVTIKIYTDNYTDEAIREGTCAGKVEDNGKYEWQLKIQEKEGIVSRNDQEVLVECDFTDADTFQLSGDTEIKRERWFRRSNIKKPIAYLKEKEEKVELSVVDPSTGAKLVETQIGSPVVLRIDFGLGDGNVATGVQPYNCDAASTDGEQKVRFLDDKSCPAEGFPISAFFKNGTTKSLITKPFALFGFDGTEEVDYHCSYTLCFGDDPCLGTCEEDAENRQMNSTSLRHRRSARGKSQRITGTVSVLNV